MIDSLYNMWPTIITGALVGTLILHNNDSPKKWWWWLASIVVTAVTCIYKYC